MTTCLVVQHLAAEPAMAIEDALTNAGVTLDTRRVFAGDPIPNDVSALDALVVMGGSMSAQSDDAFPTRRSEVALLGDALRSGIPTLGVCLGAQLLAVAAGSSVFPGDRGSEIGWGPVALLADCHDDPLFVGLPDELTVLHWHGDTFDLPAAGRRLMSNANYANQAFRIGAVAWGIQFHLEATAPGVEGFVSTFIEDAASAPGGAQGIREGTPEYLNALATTRDRVFDRFARLVAASVARGELVDLE